MTEDVTDELFDEMEDMVNERFSPQISYVAAGGDVQYRNPRSYKLKMRFTCPKDQTHRWTSSYGLI